MTTIDFTDEEINTLKNLLESKDKELYLINNIDVEIRKALF